MEGVTLYVGILAAVTTIIVLAAWPPRPWLVAVLIAGPAIGVLALYEVWPLVLLGWLPVLGVAYLYLLIPPLLPWRKRWASLGVPGVVMILCVILAMSGGPAVATYLLLPFVASATAPIVAVTNRRSTATRPSTSGPSHSP